MINILAPQSYATAPRPYIFLAGSIEMGTAERWQARVIEACRDMPGTILNPRRDDWDASWVQSIGNEKFREQVEWELDAQANADLIAFYFSADTKSPITLLELGLCIQGPIIVCCPQGFWRKGNVDIVCKRHGVECTASFEDFVERIRAWVMAPAVKR